MHGGLPPLTRHLPSSWSVVNPRLSLAKSSGHPPLLSLQRSVHGVVHPPASPSPNWAAILAVPSLVPSCGTPFAGISSRFPLVSAWKRQSRLLRSSPLNRRVRASASPCPVVLGMRAVHAWMGGFARPLVLFCARAQKRFCAAANTQRVLAFFLLLLLLLRARPQRLSLAPPLASLGCGARCGHGPGAERRPGVEARARGRRFFLQTPRHRPKARRARPLLRLPVVLFHLHVTAR